MICPLDLEELNRMVTDDSGGFFQDSKWHISISEILVDIHGAVTIVFEFLGLAGHLQTFLEL